MKDNKDRKEQEWPYEGFGATVCLGIVAVYTVVGILIVLAIWLG